MDIKEKSVCSLCGGSEACPAAEGEEKVLRFFPLAICFVIELSWWSPVSCQNEAKDTGAEPYMGVYGVDNGEDI